MGDESIYNFSSLNGHRVFQYRRIPAFIVDCRSIPAFTTRRLLAVFASLEFKHDICFKQQSCQVKSKTIVTMAQNADFDGTVSPSNSKQSFSRDGKRLSPDRARRSLMSPVKKLSALRLVSPIDSDQELIDLEVASVLAEGGSVSPSKVKRHETPVRPATVMTNVQRGNVQTTTPVFQQVTLHHLAAQGELNTIKQEVDQGADLNKVDDNGLSPLLWACANGQLLTVKYFLEMNVELDIVGSHQENGLLFASCYGYTEIVKLLLQLGMDVNYVDETSSSSLMYAAYNNHSSCVKLLLDYGADMTLQNENGHTAMDLAVGQGHKSVQQAMESHMLKLFEALT